jgi:type I restriction enzyme, S subunit
MTELQKAKLGYNLIEIAYSRYLEIPNEWTVSQFSDVAKIKRGSSPRPIGDQRYFGDGRGWVRITDVSKSFKYLTKTEDRLSPLGESRSVEVNEGDTILSIAASVGKPIIVNMKACIHDGFVKFADLSPSMNSEFLYYLLCQMENRFTAMGQQGTQNNLNSEIISRMMFAKPPLKEQEKIASILSKVDDLIQKTDEIVEQTRRLKKGLMQQLLTKGIDHTEYKEENVGLEMIRKQIPSLWKVERLKELANIVRGQSPRPAGNPKFYGGPVPWITVGEITKDDRMYLDSVEEGLSELGKKESRFLDKGTVLLSNSGATLGKPKILHISGCINDGVAAFMDLDISHIIPEFLYYVLLSWEKLIRSLNQGVFQVNINTEIIGKIITPLPPLSEQREIVAILSNIDSLIQSYISQGTLLTNLKRGLMQKLLTGKIRVKV